MRMIQDLIDRMDDELLSAKFYAEDYLRYKSESNSALANKYKEMSNDELKHATYIHDETISKIDTLKSVYKPPVNMTELWKTEHASYVEKIAWIRQMLSM